MSDRGNFSANRYFWARFKPLGRPLFWLPLGITALSLLGYWQYQQNPDWIGGTPNDRPRISIEDEDTPPAAREEALAPAENPAPAAEPPATDGTQDNAEAVENTAPGDPLPAITGNSRTTRNKNRDSSLFLPLLPTAKPNSSASAVKPLAPIQVTPATGDTNYPLQGAIDNISRPRAIDNPPATNSNFNNPNPAPTTGGNFSQAPVPAPNAPYNFNPNPPQGVTPIPPAYNPQPGAMTGYPNQPPQTGYNNPGNYQAPQAPTRNYTIQRPIDARSSGY